MNKVAATRMNLLRARKRLDQVAKGTGLLRRKREALVTELFRLARRAVDTRAQIDDIAAKAYPDLLRALATHGAAGLRAIGWPTRSLTVDLRAVEVWGVAVADIERRPPIQRTAGARGTAPGSAGAAVPAAAGFETLTEALLDAAAREVLIRRLGDALARTSRQVHTLERRVTPDLASQIRSVHYVLGEREREEYVRLKHIVRKRHPSAGRR